MPDVGIIGEKESEETYEGIAVLDQLVKKCPKVLDVGWPES
jgi:hypothetical protein